MRKWLLHSCFCLLAVAGYSQSSQLVLTGSVRLDDNSSYTYKLVLHDSVGKWHGYSITNSGAKDETRFAVTATINDSKARLTFREWSVISTKEKVADAEYCFLRGTLRIVGDGPNRQLLGSIDGYVKNGKEKCGHGMVALKCNNWPGPHTPIPQHETDTAVALPLSEVKQVAPAAPIVNNSPSVVAPDSTLHILCAGPTATIELWDAFRVDGDIVSLWEGDKQIVSKHRINKEHYTIQLAIPAKGRVTLRLVAENEGNEPPNTARLQVRSGETYKTVDATTRIGHDVHIVLYRD